MRILEGLSDGSVELYEIIEKTVIWELQKEIGIVAEDLDLITVLSGKDYYFEYLNGHKMCTVIVLFTV